MNWLKLAIVTALVLMLRVPTALAQVHLSGNWQPDRILLGLPEDPPAGGLLGIGTPLNEDGRAMMATANPGAEGEEPNKQCQPWLVDYALDGSGGLLIRSIGDSRNENNVLAWHIAGTPDRPAITAWVDGRSAPPPQALHTWGGFARGEWRGNTLVITVTHLMDGWMKQNGTPQSNQATVTLFLSREGEQLTETFVLRDPVYLSEPYVRARTFRLSEASPATGIPTTMTCLPAETVAGLDGYHAARLPLGKNPLLDSISEKYGLPKHMVLGGAQQMYPEYQNVLRKEYRRPPGYCETDCNGPSVPTGDERAPLAAQKRGER